MSSVLTVSQINAYIKSVFDYDRKLKNVFICGEISNFTDHYKSGHLYFSLKDENSVIKAVMFSKSAMGLKFKPKDGMKVIVSAQVSVYEASGQYQLYVRSMQPDGLGALNLAYEQLKEKLEKEGLFDKESKRQLPHYPKNIAVITSPTGAAIRDIFQIITRRWPLCTIDFYPSSVQGASAVPELLSAMENVETKGESDLIIIGRGGGSIEDLWAFNDEELARAVYNSPIPVISAVGHETDFTICDFVADLRAPTPSAAAELATPNIDDEAESLAILSADLYAALDAKIYSASQELDKLSSSHALSNPKATTEDLRNKLSLMNTRLCMASSSLLSKTSNEFSSLTAALDSLSPLKVLSRGYAIAQDKSMTVINSIDDVETNDIIKIRLRDGLITANVSEKRAMK